MDFHEIYWHFSCCFSACSFWWERLIEMKHEPISLMNSFGRIRFFTLKFHYKTLLDCLWRAGCIFFCKRLSHIFCYPMCALNVLQNLGKNQVSTFLLLGCFTFMYIFGSLLLVCCKEFYAIDTFIPQIYNKLLWYFFHHIWLRFIY